MANQSYMKDWKIDFDSLRSIVPFLIFGIAAFVAFSPFFLKGQLPLWSTDNLYGSYAPMVYSRENFWNGFCGWMPYSFCGMNFLSSVNNMTYSPLLMLVYLLPMNFFWSGLALLQFFCLWSIGYLAFLFIRRVLLHDGWAIFAALIYQLNPQVLFSFQTFPMPILHVFFLCGCYSIWNLGEKSTRTITSFIVIAMSFTGLMLSGHLVYVAHFMLVLFVLFFFRHGFRPGEVFSFGRPANLFLLALLTSVFVGSIRWLPFWESLHDSSRVAAGILGDHREYIFRATRLFIPEIFGVTNASAAMVQLHSGLAGYGGNQHDFFHYFGVLAIFFIILSFVKHGLRDNTFWKLLALFYAVLMLRVMPFAYLTNLLFFPFLHGAVLVGSTLTFSVLAGYAGKSLTCDLNVTGGGVGNIAKYPSGASALGGITLWGLAILATVISYVSMVWLPVWSNNKLGVTIAQTMLYFFLIFLLLIFKNRNDTRVLRRYRTIGLILLGVVFICVILASIVVSFSGSGQFYRILLVNELAPIAALLLVMCIIMIPRLSRYRFLLAIFVGFSLIVGIPWYSKAGASMITDILWRDNIYILLLGVSRLLIIFSLMTTMFFLYARKKITSGFFCVVCCLISFIDLSGAFKNSSFLVCRPFISMENKAFFQAGLKFPDLDLHDYRVNFPHHLINPSPLYSARKEFEELSNIPIAYKIPYYGGVNSQSTAREVAFLRGMLGAGPSEIGLSSDSKDDRFLDLVGARYDLRFDRVAVRPSALSRFMLFFDYEVIRNDKKLLERLKDDDLNPMTTLVVSDDVGIMMTGKESAKKVEYVSRSEDEIDLNLDVARDALLLFNDTVDGGWRAFVDGSRVPVHRANFKFMAIAVPSGQHNIKFIFEPDVMYTIKSLSWAGVALFLFVAFCLMRTQWNYVYTGIFLIIAISGPSFFMGQAYLEKKSKLLLDRKAKQMTDGCGSKYFGYRVVCQNNAFYALPQSLDLPDLVKDKGQTLPGVLVGKSLEEVQKQIDGVVDEKRQKLVEKSSVEAPKPIAPPVLVTDHKKYNIVYYDDIFYAVPQWLGELDLANEQDRIRPDILRGGSWEEAEELIAKAATVEGQKFFIKTDETMPERIDPPMLVTEHRGYNIVFYSGVFYAVPQSLGPMDLSIEANRMRPEIVTGSTVKKAKRNIDKVLTRKILTRLRKAFFSFFRWLNKGWGPV